MNGETLEADKIFIDVGARAFLPPIPGLEGVDCLTNSSMMEVDFLWGGANNSDHFEITKMWLKPDQLHFGVGRETFAALIDPEFSRASPF